MNKVELDSALSALSGRSCTYAFLLLNRTRFYLGLVFALLVGVATGVLIHQWLVGTIVWVALISIAERLSDRRIVGIDIKGLIQAKSAVFVARPTELLAPLQFAEVQVLNTGTRNNALFRIDGTAYVGTRGSIALAGALQSRQA